MIMTMKSAKYAKRNSLIQLIAVILLGQSSLALANEENEKQLESEVNVLNNRIDQLEEKINKSASDSRSVAKFRNRENPPTEKLKFSGFASYGVSYADHDIETSDVALKNEFSYRTDSIMGFQTDYKLSDQFSTTAQLVARGVDDFAVSTEWLYLTWRANSAFNIQMGRLRYPGYMYSESFEVGATYHWVRPPLAYYVSSARALEGIKFITGGSTGEFYHVFKVTVGASQFEYNNIAAENNDIYIWEYKGIYKDLQIYAGQYQAAVGADLSPELHISDAANVSSLGLKYDDGHWLGVLESFRIRSKNNVLTPDNQSVLLSFGYYITPTLLLHTTATNIYTEKPSIAVGKQEGTSASIGVRYSFTPSVVLKFEAERFFDFNGTLGPTAGFKGEPVELYSMVVDTVFF
jgi:outer membrane murein-binding lipoprotein Lpp